MEQLQKGFDSAQTENEALRDQLARMKRDADQAKLDSDKKIAAFKDQTETAIAKISQVAADRDTAQSKLAETQSQLESVESELEKVKVANAEAGKKLTELQSNLDQATAEVERLKSQQKNDASSQDSGAIAPPPIQ
jgi:chromosome segregation ATPase